MPMGQLTSDQLDALLSAATSAMGQWLPVLVKCSIGKMQILVELLMPWQEDASRKVLGSNPAKVVS